MPPTVRIGTRASALALAQTGHVADALTHTGGLDVELVRVRTDGDRLTGSLATLGGTGVFVTALRDALADRRCDVAVHSLKDLPTGSDPRFDLGAVPLREDPRDALCARDGWTLATLPVGARVGTGSPRRAAQLLAARPDLEVVDLRGNVDTRLRRVAAGDLDAVVLARAGLTRLGRLDAVTDTLDPSIMTPAAGQGALAIEIRAAAPGAAAAPGSGTAPDENAAADVALRRAVAAIDDPDSRIAVLAERALLARLEAGCAAPVGALARVDRTASVNTPDASPGDEVLTLDAVVIRTDGGAELRLTATCPLPLDPPRDRELAAVALGTRLADELLAAGAADLADLGPR